MPETHQIRFDCPCLIFFKLNIFIQKDVPNKFDVKERVDVTCFVDNLDDGRKLGAVLFCSFFVSLSSLW